MNESNTIVFYLSTTHNLSAEYFLFHELFKERGIILIPVKVDQLQALALITEQEHIIVISSIKKYEELKDYNRNARHLLKYLLKSKRISFFNLSSFSSTDDTKVFYNFRNYFFIRLPVDAKIITNKLVRYYSLKQAEKIAWPGGKRAGLSSVGV